MKKLQKKKTKKINKLTDCRPTESGNELLTKEAVDIYFKTILNQNKTIELLKTDQEQDLYRQFLKKVNPKDFKEQHLATLFTNDDNLGIYKRFNNTSFIVKTNIDLETDD